MYLYKTKLQIFSYIPRLSSKIGMTLEYLFLKRIPFLTSLVVAWCQVLPLLLKQIVLVSAVQFYILHPSLFQSLIVEAELA